MDAAACFKCHSEFVSYRALEVHLRHCDVPFEPRVRQAWAFIPPPDTYGPPRERRPRRPAHASEDAHAGPGPEPGPRPRPRSAVNQQQKQQRQTPAQRPGAASTGRRAGPPSPTSPGPSRRDGADGPLRRRAPAARGTAAEPGGECRCTKCDIAFADPDSLAKHFVDSPLHPYSVAPPRTSWEPPVAIPSPGADADGGGESGVGRAEMSRGRLLKGDGDGDEIDDIIAAFAELVTI